MSHQIRSVVRRRELTKDTKRQHIETMLWLGGKCPCCQRRAVIDEFGNKLQDAEWDHFFAPHRAAANETWLVLGVGILLVAFPMAHGAILTALYLPVAVMLCGLILRGVAFDFRVKAHASHKPLWNRIFWAGSATAGAAPTGSSSRGSS